MFDEPLRESGDAPVDPLQERTQADLEWPALLARIAGYSVSQVARHEIFRTLPAPKIEQAHTKTRRVREALILHERGEPVPRHDVPDLSDVLARLSRDAPVTALELSEVAQLLHYAARLRQYGRQHQEQAPELARALFTERVLDELLAKLERAVEPNGEIKNGASRKLQSLRSELRELRRDLEKRLASLSERYAEVLREPRQLVVDGRYVLAVRADAHLRVDGIVLGASSSGATLYVEPQQVTPLVNRFRIAGAEEEREVGRIVSELSRDVKSELAAVITAYAAAVEANVIGSIAHFAADTSSLPMLVEPEPIIDLKAMRHPLLIGPNSDVVANDLCLRSGSALVVSGPNAGGKTVALKCLGLASWMARAGLPIPASEGSRIGWFEPVLTDVGDDQSIMQSLSTFSGHIKNLARILDHAADHALVLLDEVAAGTDPDEGSALAGAVLTALVEKGAAVAVTTHYDRLKELAAQEPRFENASVGFDFERMAPTFKLKLGVPGPSSALLVAARYGLPSAVIERAKSLLSETAIEREELVRRLQREQQRVEELLNQAELEARRQVQLSESVEQERRSVRERERARLAREAGELMDAVRQARGRLAAAERELQKERLTAKALRDVEHEIDLAARQVALGSPLASAVVASPADATGPNMHTLRPGATVRWKKVGSKARVLKAPERGSVQVQAGSMKLTLPIDELEVLAPASAAARPAEQPRRPARSSGSPLKSSDNTLDLRGARVDEALDRAEAFIDRLMSQGESGGFVLHGHGTGALKAALRDHLRRHRFVARAYPAEPDDGGDAFTVIVLKD